MSNPKRPQPYPSEKHPKIRIRPCFHAWLQTQAEEQGRFLHMTLEHLVSQAVGGKPWEKRGKR